MPGREGLLSPPGTWWPWALPAAGLPQPGALPEVCPPSDAVSPALCHWHPPRCAFIPFWDEICIC